MFGDAPMALWQHEGMATTDIEGDAQTATGMYLVAHDTNGHEFSYLRAGSAASRITPQWLPLDEARAASTRAIRQCDLSLPSIDDLRTLCGQNDRDALLDWSHSMGARQVVLKLGSDGERRQWIAGHRVHVVDATGAGNCFCGNLLACLALGDSLIDAARYANAAALAVQGFGTVAPLPLSDQVRALL